MRSGATTVSCQPQDENSVSSLAHLVQLAVGPRQSYVTPFEGLTLYQFRSPTKPTACTYPASFLYTAQGGKHVDARGQSFVVNKGSYLVTEAALPVMSHVARASPIDPYLAFFLKLDMSIVRQVIAAEAEARADRRFVDSAAGVGTVTPEIGSCCKRILHLLNRGGDISFLRSLLVQELTYLLLESDQGSRLRRAASATDDVSQTEAAVAWLSRYYAKPLAIETLAKQCCMSTSTLYSRFKKLTGMSPLQYQKMLRLAAARQRLRATGADVASVSFLVGYQSPSQFSREYKRLFGLSPAKDARTRRILPTE